MGHFLSGKQVLAPKTFLGLRLRFLFLEEKKAKKSRMTLQKYSWWTGVRKITNARQSALTSQQYPWWTMRHQLMGQVQVWWNTRLSQSDLVPPSDAPEMDLITQMLFSPIFHLHKLPNHT
jgi:hypothetical protein